MPPTSRPKADSPVSCAPSPSNSVRRASPSILSPPGSSRPRRTPPCCTTPKSTRPTSHRYTYAQAEHRSKQLANALRRLGIKLGDRVGTLAWNGYRHYELYFGVSGIGAICHTINPRLFHDQLDYIVNHAEDAVICFD